MLSSYALLSPVQLTCWRYISLIAPKEMSSTEAILIEPPLLQHSQLFQSSPSLEDTTRHVSSQGGTGIERVHSGTATTPCPALGVSTRPFALCSSPEPQGSLSRCRQLPDIPPTATRWRHNIGAVEAPAWQRPEGAARTGEYDVIWDGTNERRNLVASGVYFVRVRVGHETLERKVVLLR